MVGLMSVKCMPMPFLTSIYMEVSDSKSILNYVVGNFYILCKCSRYYNHFDDSDLWVGLNIRLILTACQASKLIENVEQICYQGKKNGSMKCSIICDFDR